MNKFFVLLFIVILFMMGCNGDATKEMLSPSVTLYFDKNSIGSGVIIETYRFTDKEDIAIILTVDHIIKAAQIAKKDIKVMLFSYENSGRLKDFKKVDSISCGGDEFFDLAFLIAFIPKDSFLCAKITKKFEVLPGNKLYSAATFSGCIPFLNEGVFGGYYPSNLNKCINGIFTGGIQKGCSGGPIYNEKYELVGIITGYTFLKNKLGLFELDIEYKHMGCFTPVDKKMIDNLKTLLIGI